MRQERLTTTEFELIRRQLTEENIKMMEIREQIDKMSAFGDEAEREYDKKMKVMELETHYDKTQKIDTYFNTNKDDRPKFIEELAKARSKMGKRFK